MPHDPTSDADKRQILRRRAFFVSSALGALGCTPAEAPSGAGTAPSPATNDVPIPSATTPGEATSDAGVDDASPPPRVEAGASEMPSLEIPSGINKVAVGHYQNLQRDVPALHARLDELEELIPDACAIGEARCDAAWRRLADGLWDLQRRLWRLGPRCAGSSEDAKAFNERLQAHRQLLERRQKQIVDTVTQGLSATADRERWEKHQTEARAASPQPCLKYACEDW